MVNYDRRRRLHFARPKGAHVLSLSGTAQHVTPAAQRIVDQQATAVFNARSTGWPSQLGTSGTSCSHAHRGVATSNGHYTSGGTDEGVIRRTLGCAEGIVRLYYGSCITLILVLQSACRRKFICKRMSRFHDVTTNRCARLGLLATAHCGLRCPMRPQQ
jgi:hypothetical protein